MMQIATLDVDSLFKQTYEFLQATILPPIEWPALNRILQDREDRRITTRHAYTDTFPSLTYLAAGGKSAASTPLSSFWILYTLAARIFDDIQDGEGAESLWNQGGNHQSLPVGLALLTMANNCLVHLQTEVVTLQAIMAAFGHSWTLAAKSQAFPPSTNLSLEEYMSNIVASTGAVFAAAAWAGARLYTNDESVLQALRLYGYHAGMVSAILSDCQGLKLDQSGKVPDLLQGTYKLPVIYGASLTDHPLNSSLKSLLAHSPLTIEQAEQIVAILEEMRAIHWSLCIAAAHQQKAIAALDNLPAGRKQALVNYVSQ